MNSTLSSAAHVGLFGAKSAEVSQMLLRVALLLVLVQLEMIEFTA